MSLLLFKSFGVQLQNWRQPFFITASEMDRAEKSVSGMFWDDLGGSELFDRSLWLDSGLSAINYWMIEPQISGAVYAPQGNGVEPSYWNVNLLSDIRFKNFFIRQNVNVDKRYEYDPDYPAHRGRDVRGRFDEAYVHLDWKYGFFRLGRLYRNWGPFADRSLVLSSNPYSYDAFEWQVHSSIFEFRHLFSAFPFKRSSADTDNRTQTNRYLTAHSLNVILGSWVTLGFTESVVFARARSLPDLQYVNPFSIYTVVNTNQEGDGNLMLGFQWKIHPFTKAVSFKGQVALDDFQVDNDKVTDSEPSHWGTDLGLFWRDPFKLPFAHMIKTEYNFRSHWLYTIPDNNGDRGERYTYLSESLGFSQNDGDRISAGFTIVGNNYWVVETELAYARQGGWEVTSRWRDNEPEHIQGLPFDTTYTQEKNVEILLKSQFYFRDYADLLLCGSASWIKNRDNFPGTSFEFSPSISARLSLHFSDFHLRLPE